MRKPDPYTPKTVFNGLVWEAEMIKNLLENEGIEAFLNDELIGTIAPFCATPRLGSVKVVVAEVNFEKAKEVVALFEENRSKEDTELENE